MIILYTFGPAFGLPDPSPFVTKTDVLLKMAGQAYRTDTTGFRKAPKGKLPYIRDNDVVVADSTFIRLHLERRYGVDFDKGYSPAERGVAWAIEKMCEDHLYWLAVHERWMNPANFAKGPAHFFDQVPGLIRSPVQRFIRGQVRRALHHQGLGRHGDAERVILGERDLTSLAAILGDKPYLLGDRPCGADATVYAFVSGVLCPLFDSALRKCAAGQPNLVAYRDRLTREFYPDLAGAGATAR